MVKNEPKIVYLGSQKGGAGKSTMAIHLAVGLKNQNKKVLLVDSDPQHSTSLWSKSGGSELVDTTVLEDDQDLKKLKTHPATKEYDYILIDGAPRIEKLLAISLIVCDFLLIPFMPSAFDLWAVSEIVKLVKERQKQDKKLKAAFLLNAAQQNTNISNEALDAVRGYGLPVLETVIGRRVSFIKSVAKGKTAFQTTDWRAKNEIDDLVTEVLKMMKG